MPDCLDRRVHAAILLDGQPFAVGIGQAQRAEIPTPRNSASAFAIAASGTPVSRPTAIAASALRTLWTPAAASSIARSRAPLARATNRMRPATFTTSVARRSASSASP